MKALFFELTDDGTQSTTGKLGITGQRLRQMEHIVVETMMKNLGKGTASLMQLLTIEAQTIQEYGVMCKLVGQIECQLAEVFPTIIPKQYVSEFDIRNYLKHL